MRRLLIVENDRLLAKPFRPMELAVKALTFWLRRQACA
jgi:hypothetical protein